MARPTRRRPALAVLGVLAAVLLTACGASDGAGGSGRPTVVASTDVWGAVAAAVAGPDADVRSIITSPSADPHSYESTPADAAAITRAAVVVANGGGYDGFVQKVVGSDDALRSRTVEAFALRGDPADDNEHVWFDPVAVRGVAGQVADRLGALEPDRSAALHERAAAFGARVDAEAARLAAVGAARPGATVLSTEPVAHYLLRMAGVADVTPPSFVDAVEAQNAPSVADLQGVGTTLATRGVTALVVNPQTETPISDDLRRRADAAGVPVVEVTETLPDGTDYLTWLAQTRAGLARALGVPA